MTGIGVVVRNGRLASVRGWMVPGSATVYYALAGRGIVRALEGLDWLIVMLRGRAITASRLRRTGVYVEPLVSPYVAEEPDGPVAGADPMFRLGRSWSVESPTGR